MVYAAFRAAKELWDAGERNPTAFAMLLAALVKTLPAVMVASLIALGGAWLLNNLDLSSVGLPDYSRTIPSPAIERTAYSAALPSR